MKEINWTTTPAETRTIRGIADRAVKLYKSLANVYRDNLTIQMDVTATHCNGCPLRLEDLLKADNLNFMHDIGGIAKHINRQTGELDPTFLPRFAKPENKKEVAG